MFMIQCGKMFKPKVYSFKQNENVGDFIKNLLESEECNEIGIVKVSRIEKLNKIKCLKCVFNSITTYGRMCMARSRVHRTVACAKVHCNKIIVFACPFQRSFLIII